MKEVNREDCVGVIEKFLPNLPNNIREKLLNKNVRPEWYYRYLKKYAIRVITPRPGDIVICKVNHTLVYAGIYIENGIVVRMESDSKKIIKDHIREYVNTKYEYWRYIGGED